MKSNLRDKFRDFLASEEGQVGAKAPLALGVASGSLLLAQAMLPADAQAHMECRGPEDCSPGEICIGWEQWEWSPPVGLILVQHSECVDH